MHCGNCTQRNALYVHTLFPLGQQADVPVPPGKAARAMLIWPQRDVPCREIACLQLGYASFSDETSSSPSTAARIRCFACTPASCASWQIWVCCMYSMFCFTAWYIICATCASVRHWRCFTGHMQSFSQQPAACSAKNSPKKMVAGSVRQVFCLCPVQNSVRGRDSACPEAHLQLSQFNLLCSRRYVLSTFFQCLQEGSFLQYAYDPVSTSLVCKR